MNFFKYEKQKENFTSIIPLVTKEKSSVSSKGYTNSTLQCSCKKKTSANLFIHVRHVYSEKMPLHQTLSNNLNCPKCEKSLRRRKTFVSKCIVSCCYLMFSSCKVSWICLVAEMCKTCCSGLFLDFQGKLTPLIILNNAVDHFQFLKLSFQELKLSSLRHCSEEGIEETHEVQLGF